MEGHFAPSSMWHGPFVLKGSESHMSLVENKKVLFLRSVHFRNRSIHTYQSSGAKIIGIKKNVEQTIAEVHTDLDKVLETSSPGFLAAI